MFEPSGFVAEDRFMIWKEEAIYAISKSRVSNKKKWMHIEGRMWERRRKKKHQKEGNQFLPRQKVRNLGIGFSLTCETSNLDIMVEQNNHFHMKRHVCFSPLCLPCMWMGKTGYKLFDCYSSTASLILYKKVYTVEPLSNGHHWFSKKVSAIARCPL